MNQLQTKFLRILVTVFVTFTAASDNTEGMRNFGNREEGTAVEAHGSEDLALLGLHRDFQSFPKNSELLVRFYLPKILPQGGSRRVSLEAREIVDSRHYLMRSKQPAWSDGEWNSFSPWPTKDVIDQLGLDSSNIAVLASYRDGNTAPVYVPVDVLSTSSGTPVKRPYTFHFETSWNIHSLDKSVTSPDGHKTVLKADRCNISPTCVLYSAASSHSFDVDMKDFPEGVYTIDLLGHLPGTSLTPNLRIRVYHHPN